MILEGRDNLLDLQGLSLPGLPPQVFIALPVQQRWHRHVITIRMTPPTLNRIPGMHWSQFKKVKQDWQREIEQELLVAQVPRGRACVLAGASIQFPSGATRRRDAGNFSVVPEKALGDALVNGGWLPDDTPEFFRFVGVEFVSSAGPARTQIVLLAKEDHGN
jgi:hypothetical protein